MSNISGRKTFRLRRDESDGTGLDPAPHEVRPDLGPTEPGTTSENPEAHESLGERITQQLASQWALIRAERRAEPPPQIATGPSNFSRAQVPWGIDLAAAWSWRFVVIALAGYLIARTIADFAVVTVPIAIALLLAALVSPMVRALCKSGIPRSLSTLVTVIFTLGFLGLLITFAGQQVATGASDLADQVVKGLDEIRAWLRDGPLHASDSQINDYIEETQNAITNQSKDGALGRVGSVGSALSHVAAGLFIVLFGTYFFLADGERIWAWLVRLAPRAAREHVDNSGRVAWVSLTMFVRATVLVALADAVGVMIVAAVLGVPFILAIGVLVFLGAFVPMIGATVAGTVAVLVALVDQGPVTALLMLGGVVLVQQIEGHVLQPFLMGRFVSLHPLGVIIALACGIIVAGIAGALVAVPLAAAVNAVVQYLANDTDLGEPDPEDALTQDIGEARAEGHAAEPVPAVNAPVGDDGDRDGADG
ncbi:AI-2E family transporter [Nocardioides houyundeii]|uniref:AI-2E family transporter n=1 Tax=Nocardioides houyundeii TaxID=2045452 RepID=UPI001F534191|nr:AI-2E family transporter [Nocardioides houyundeii]